MASSEELLSPVDPRKEVKSTKNEHELKFKCTFPDCSQAYDRKWKLSRHTCSHTNERPFACEFVGCKKSYQCKTHLARHVKTFHHRLESCCLQCTVPGCITTFTTKSALNKHVKNHDKASKYKCSICDVRLLTEKRLNDHENAHKGVLPYACNVCNSQWSNNSLLRRHMKCHVRKKCPEKECDVETDTFNQMRKHLKLKHFIAYDCATCGKQFVNKYYLKEHVLHHLPKDTRNVLRCPFNPCLRQYYHERNLKHHMKVFHRQQRYFCGIHQCQSSYFFEDKLAAHKKRNHKVVDREFFSRIAEKSIPNDDTADEVVSSDSDNSDYPGHYLMLVMKDQLTGSMV